MANRILRAKTNGGLKATELTEGESLYYDIEADPGNAAAASALDGTEVVTVEQSGSPVKTTAQDIADLGGGGSATWTDILSLVNATPPSTSTITTLTDLRDSPDYLEEGMPLRFKTTGDSSWRYALLYGITDITITISGSPLVASTDWLTNLEVAKHLPVVQRDIFIPGYWLALYGAEYYFFDYHGTYSPSANVSTQVIDHTAEIDTEVMDNAGGGYFPITRGKRLYLVHAELSQGIANASTQPQISVFNWTKSTSVAAMSGSGNPLPSPGSSAELKAADNTNYVFDSGDKLQLKVTNSVGTDAASQDLFVQLTFIPDVE